MEACEDSGDPILEAYAELSSLGKVMSTDAPMLRMPIVQTRFEVLQDTGRTGSSKPNVQNIRRLPGIRECFVARPGTLIVDADYSMIELHTWAQVCIWMLGRSRLAELINAGVDPHLSMGARIIGVTYEHAKAHKRDKEIKEARQLAKPVNFGLPGGMGARGLQRYAKKSFGIDRPLADWENLRALWLTEYPEAQPYFDAIRSRHGWRFDFAYGGEVTTVQHWVSGRYRGRVDYCAACNGGFQGLAVDLAKDAGFQISRECYDPAAESMLFGSRIVNFVHDQFLVECPEACAASCAVRIREIMEGVSPVWLPDVPAKCEPALCRYWSKETEPTYNAEGSLVAWTP
jgi:DNA polymerase I-like protein with 3'-5' exonuclease and polymerase domains